MSSIKVQEICEIPMRSGLRTYYHLKDEVIHWTEGKLYKRLNLETGELLEPIELPIRGHLVSISHNEIEVAKSLSAGKYEVYSISLDPIELLDLRIVETRNSREGIQLRTLGTLYAKITRPSSPSGPIKIIPLSKHGRYFEIEEQEGYMFQDITLAQGSILSLWTKDNTYHILGPEGMKDTKIFVPDKRYRSKFTLFKSHLITTSSLGLWINEDRVEILCRLYTKFLSEDHLIVDTKVYRIKDLEDIKVKSCTKRT